MFTGIIHHTAEVASIQKVPAGLRITLVLPLAQYILGESIAVNGCCLTVAHIAQNHLSFDVIPETLAKTNLGSLAPGDIVHVERSLRAGDPIDGHFVQGHIDGAGQLLSQTNNAEQFRLRIAAPPELAKYLVPKGSIAIDGVSLTLASIEGNQFEVALIPTTLALTTLGKKQAHYRFNLEFDLMAKTIISYLERIAPRADDVKR